MNKFTQTKVKTNWLNTMFVFILSTILSYSVFAGNTWELTDGKIAIPYNEYGAPGALGESVEWQAGNSYILDEAVFDATENTAWSPKIGEVFTVTVEGFADFTGKIAISLADRRMEVDYWATLANDDTFDVVEGENFSKTITFKITHTEKNGIGLFVPEIVFTALPNITSTDHSFSKDDKHLYLNNFMVEYTPAPKYKEIVKMPHDLEFKSSEYRNILMQTVYDETNTAWIPEVGEVFTVTVEGFADFTGELRFSDKRKEFDDYTINVVEGEAFSKIFILKITNITNRSYRPILELTARPNITSTESSFSKEDKHLYLNNFMVEYTPALNPEDYATVISAQNFNYSTGLEFSESDLWQYTNQDIIEETVTTAGYTLSSIVDGDRFIIHAKGIADFNGTMGFYLMDNASWNLCSSFKNIPVKYGKVFEINDTLIIANTNANATTIQLQLDITNDDKTSPKDNDLHLYLNEFSTSFSSQYCKVIVYSNDVTDVHSIFIEDGEVHKSTGYGKAIIEDIESEPVYGSPSWYEIGRAFTVLKGSQIAITATVNPGGEFYSWEDGSTEAVKIITVPDEDTLELYANFRQLEFINYGTFDGPEFKLRALDTTAIYLPEVIQASYGTPLTYKIVKENELVPTKISNDTLYFMPPVGAIGNHISISVEATLPNETSRVSEFRTSFYPVQRDSLFPTPQIALVTVSKESGKNLVVWQKFETDKIDHYNIYRETEVAGEYKKIAEVPYSETSIFEDTEADPLVRAWRYKISASPVDTRYTESELSKAHKTIHLTKNMGMNNTYNLIWDKYEGLDFSTFVVIRNYKVGTTEIYTDTIAEIPSNVNSYTDLNPQKRTISYYVAIKLKDTVDVNEYLKAEIGPFVLAMSNIAEIENEQDGDPTAIDNIENAIVVYAANKIIYVKNANKRATVYNIAGALVAQSQNDSDSQEIAVEKAGIYFVKIANKLYKVIVE